MTQITIGVLPYHLSWCIIPTHPFIPLRTDFDQQETQDRHLRKSLGGEGLFPSLTPTSCCDVDSSVSSLR